jgi:hypothetical protein
VNSWGVRFGWEAWRILVTGEKPTQIDGAVIYAQTNRAAVNTIVSSTLPFIPAAI